MDSRAYSIFSVKSIDSESRIIEGIASTPELDRQEDILDSEGAKFTLPLPLLWMHQKDKPIGHVLSATVTKSSIKIRARIEKGVLPFIDEAWALIKSGLVRGLSIGWRPLSPPTLVKGTYHYKSWEWLELSAVTVPANQSATIQLIKSFDTGLAAPGTSAGVAPRPAGVSASINREAHKGARAMSNPLSEQITDLQTDLSAKSAQMEALINRDTSEGGLSDEESTELDGLTKQVTTLTKQHERLQALEAAQATKAQPLQFSPRTTGTSQSVRFETKELPKGTLFARYAMAVAAGKGSISDTVAYAKRWDGQTPEVSRYIKAVTGISTTASPGWGSELVYAENLASEFVELTRPMTIIGKLTGIRRVPFNVRIPVQTVGSTVNWVGEVGVKPVTELDFSTVTLGYDKIAGIVVMSEELVRLSSPAAEDVVRRDLADQIVRFMDEQFITPSVAAGANNPASITNGVSAPNASGNDITALFTDLNNALATFDNANLGTENVYIITTPAIARGISSMRNALGQPEGRFEVTATGGTLMGFPLIVSASVPAQHLILVKADEILLADDGKVTLDASNQATIDMAGGGTPNFNLWQRNCVGIRAERWVTWAKRRSTAVAVIDTANYGPGGSP